MARRRSSDHPHRSGAGRPRRSGACLWPAVCRTERHPTPGTVHQHVPTTARSPSDTPGHCSGDHLLRGQILLLR
eukprot:6934246-Heterocapsa_arctica.AAC.1